MANVTALMLNAAPGSSLVTQQSAHVLVSEAGAGAALAGLMMTALEEPGPLPPVEAWQQVFRRRGDTQGPPVALAVLENTHTRAGGVPLPVDYTRSVVDSARAHGVAVHLDGARLFDAAQALGTTPSVLAQGVDTVSISFNKGFGAPIAAALAGSAAAIARALVLRQRLGGGLRPIGPAAAATLAGLDDCSHFARSHGLARRLADGLAGIAGLAVESVAPRTNIVIIRLEPPLGAAVCCERLAREGLLAMPLNESRVRFVTYRDITVEQVEAALGIVRGVMSTFRA